MPQNRKSSPRLRGYEYSLPGGYFVTICTYKRVNSFGEVLDREMLLNRAGEIAQSAWRDLPNHYVNIQLDHYVVMPNHLHGIIFIKETDRRDRFLNLSLR
jgi:REP element-mobilizing transposase RayT